MTKQDYLKKLKTELEKNKIEDMDEIVAEYEQHFIFKLADGYSEEEIAAKLGEPKDIAAQFEKISDSEKKKSKPLTVALLTLAGIFETMGYLLLGAFDVVIAAAALCFGAAGMCLITGINPFGLLIPPMPYVSAVILGIALFALAVLLAAAVCYCSACIRQLIRASVRMHKNALSGKALPPLPCTPQFSGKVRRRLRRAVNISLLVFGTTFVLGFILSQILSGSLEFWHVWGWFES